MFLAFLKLGLTSFGGPIAHLGYFRDELDAFRTRPAAQAAMRGTNAAVVRLLGASLYDPVWTSAVLGPYDFALGLVGFILLTLWAAPPWLVVGLTAAGGIALAFL